MPHEKEGKDAAFYFSLHDVKDRIAAQQSSEF
jgi:hypothetical protein